MYIVYSILRESLKNVKMQLSCRRTKANRAITLIIEGAVITPEPSEMSPQQINDHEHYNTKVRRELNGRTGLEMKVFRKQLEENKRASMVTGGSRHRLR